MSLVSSNLLQGLLVRQQALPTHLLDIPLYLLCRLLLADDAPGRVGGHLTQRLRLLLGGSGIYARPHRSGLPGFVTLSLLVFSGTVGMEISWVRSPGGHLSFRDAIGDPIMAHRIPSASKLERCLSSLSLRNASVAGSQS